MTPSTKESRSRKDLPRVRAVFQDAYRQAWRELYRYVYRRVQNREEAEDITQEAYSRAFARGTGEPPSRWYLQTVALNVIRDRWRRRRTCGQEVPLEQVWLERLGGAGGDDPEGAVERAWMEGLLNRLPKEQQTVIRLRIVEGYSRVETAGRLGISEDAVRDLQYRAVQTLRRLIREPIEEETR
ncbi:MAG TPA: sigma-70 family RNA polymerase sigma factor [Bacillota bacterium]|jgi:RNA polymerase sigma-70 factor (ECF subfamily)